MKGELETKKEMNNENEILGRKEKKLEKNETTKE